MVVHVHLPVAVQFTYSLNLALFLHGYREVEMS